MQVLLVGGGGREHALAWKLAQSQHLKKLYIAPGNAGTETIGQNVPIKSHQVTDLVNFAKQNNVELAIIGPEAPLAAGIVDALEAVGINAFGPNAAAASLEADKAFARAIMRSNSIATAEGRVFEEFTEAKAYIASRDEAMVVKASGLAAGKGVFVCDDPADAIIAAEKIMCDKIFGSAGDKIIVEDKLLGQEASILAFVDSRNIYVMESSQDHKPIGENDTGANTGGMGAYSPAPVVTEDIMNQISREILVPVVDAMNRNGTPYKGILYAGLMLTAGGPRVLEFNVRFGDPETQPIIARLKSDLLEACLAVCEEKLDRVQLQWDQRPAVCVVMASGGYPGKYEKAKTITGIEQAEKPDEIMVFHAGTKRQDSSLITDGGRVLGVTALGNSIKQAKENAYLGVKKIHFENAYYRKDIADKAIKPKGPQSNNNRAQRN